MRVTGIPDEAKHEELKKVKVVLGRQKKTAGPFPSLLGSCVDYHHVPFYLLPLVKWMVNHVF